MARELRLLALIWLGLALADWIGTSIFVVAIFVFPPLAFVLAALPTLLVYLTVGAVLYAIARPILAWAPRTPARWVAAVLAAALALLAGWTIPSLVNPTVRARYAALRAGERPKPVHLAPRDTVALVQLDANPVYAQGDHDRLKSCDTFCAALLLSGYAKSVIVAFEYSATGAPAPTAWGNVYALDDTDPGCIEDEPEWKASFAGKPYSAASATGGFARAFADRFSRCIVNRGDAPVAHADIVFVDAFQATGATREFLGIDWNLASVHPTATQTVVERRNGNSTVLLARSLVHAATLDRPMYIAFGGGPDFVGTDWARTHYGQTDPGPFLTRWWGMIDDADALYARATGDPPG